MDLYLYLNFWTMQPCTILWCLTVFLLVIFRCIPKSPIENEVNNLDALNQKLIVW
jgi:hypothetical protein